MHVNVLVWLKLEASLSDMQIMRWEMDMLWHEYTLIRVKLDNTCVLNPQPPLPRWTETSMNASRSTHNKLSLHYIWDEQGCSFVKGDIFPSVTQVLGWNWHIWTVAKLNFEPICSWGWNHVGHYETGGSWLLIVFILTHCQLLKMF